MTPNAPEVLALVGEEVDEGRLKECATALKEFGPTAVVITGGNTASGSDLLYDGKAFTEIEGPVHPKDTAHGAGCAHSCALAANSAKGCGLAEAARMARAVAFEAVRFGSKSSAPARSNPWTPCSKPGSAALRDASSNPNSPY